MARFPKLAVKVKVGGQKKISMSFFRKMAGGVAPLFDVLASPLTWGCCQFLKAVRLVGIYRLPICLKVFRATGIFPIREHYCEPLFNPASLRKSLREDRDLPGIDWNTEGQFELLEKFHYNDELLRFPLQGRPTDLDFTFDPTLNPTFGSGDAEYLYSVIRHFKPRRILEIGSGNSTLIAVAAIKANREEDSNYLCDHTCIEPYEAPWLERTGAKIVRKLLEDIDKQAFRELEANDILFIDSSHMIRPQGDVIVEFLEILPILQRGVVVHVHDIFSPKDYLDEWVVDSVCFWNEQYLLEAFLTGNKDFKVIGAVNYLRHQHPDKITAKCPVLKIQIDHREPGSFWMQRVGS